ncbi:MAG: mechanosensitive ion channel family protein [Eubacterium sp.]
MTLSYFTDKIPMIVDAALHIIIALVLFAVGKRIIHAILKLLRTSFDKSSMEEGVAHFLLSIIKVALFAVLLLVLCQFLGFATSSVIALLGSAGLAVGLALQGSLANFAGGVLILVMKPFVVGDYIIVADMEGTVVGIDIVYTKLQMVDNKTVVLPNGKLADSNIVNVTNQDKRRIDLEVGVSYDADLQQVRRELQNIIAAQKEILSDEPVDVVVGALGNSSVDMAVHVWVKKEDYWPVRWRMLEQIKVRFDEVGIEIPFNQLDVIVKQETVKNSNE